MILIYLGHMSGMQITANSDYVPSKKSCKELLYRFEFPERPGALMRFVNTLRPEWSISIFHYRNHGADVGRIVVGVLVQDNEMDDWQRFLEDLGYPNWEETNNPAYCLFLGAQTV